MKKFVQILFLIFIINFTGSAQWRKVLEAPYSDLTEVSYVNEDLIFISGNSGKILKTTNNGDSYTDIYTGTDAELVGVKVFNENLIYALSKNKVFSKSTDGGNSFLLDSLEEGIGEATKMFFLNPNVGYVLTSGSGASKLLKTSDAGLNWRIVLNIPNVLITMYFKDEQHGCVVGGSTGMLNLYYTKDGENYFKGINPSFGQFNYTKFPIKAVYMCDSNIVYASGWGFSQGLQPTLFLKSTNGGETWIYQEQPIENRTYETVSGLTFKDENNGIAVGGSSKGALILKTTDGGLNWIPHYKPLGCYLHNIFSVNDLVWIIGDGGYLARSTDFFETFQNKTLIPLTGLFTIKWIDENKAFVGGDGGLLLKTTDKGNSWKFSYVYLDSVASTINAIYFVNKNIGYTAQNYRLAAKTTNGGESWFSIISPVISNVSQCFDVFFLDENIGFIVGNDNLETDFIYKTTDGGLTFTKKTNIQNKTLNSVHFKENKGVIVGKGIVGSLKGSFTTDLGETWSSCTFLGTSIVSTLNKVKFISNDTVLAIGESGLIFKSIDGGKNFNYIQTPFNGVGFQGISFTNNDSIYISGRSSGNYGDNNYVLLSTDMGDSWKNILDTNVVTSKYRIQDIELDFNNKVWMNGSFSSIFTNAAEQVSVLDNEIINNSFELKQNFPNPFNPITTINFNLSNASKVELIIYDLLGNKVKELINDYREAGNHKINFDASKLSSGIYFYTLKANNSIISKKMTLLK